MRRESTPLSRPGALLGGLLACLLLASVSARAEEKSAGAGKLVTPSGTLLRREAPDKPWKILMEKEGIPAKELLVGLPGAVLDSANGAVRLNMLTDFDHLSPLPTLETAVILNDNAKVDLDITLDRGRIDLVNMKTKGEAKVVVRFRNQAWDLTLTDPGTRVALELFGRWPHGTRFDPTGKSKEEPITTLVMLVSKGHVDRQCPMCFHALSAPPGPAFFQWDSISGQDMKVQRLEKLPEWANPEKKETEESKAARVRLEKVRKMLLDQGIDKTLDALLTSTDPLERRSGVLISGALDELTHLATMLAAAKHADAWENSVVALRHWLGRAPGQDQLLYQRIIKNRDMKPAHAQIIVQLLMGLKPEATARPETYEILIDYLQHDRIAIRGLANWHLQRLVPAAKIPFDPIGDKQSHAAAHEAWKKLIPTGKLPPQEQQ